jgi:alkyl hydroperoxide reductase subunit AhpC
VIKRQILWLAALLWLVPFVSAAAAPDLVVKDFDGKARKVGEFIGNGKWAVVVVWAADCPVCRRDIHHTVAFYSEHKKDVVVVGFSIDGYENREYARGFIRDHKLNFPNLIGTPEDAA